MAALTATTATADGTEAPTPAQISAWASPDTIASSVIGSRGVVAVVVNGTAGSLDFRVQDPGETPAGNSAANGYTTVTLAAGETHWVYIGPHNVDPSDGLCDVGASSSDAAFTIQLLRF